MSCILFYLSNCLPEQSMTTLTITVPSGENTTLINHVWCLPAGFDFQNSLEALKKPCSGCGFNWAHALDVLKLKMKKTIGQLDELKVDYVSVILYHKTSNRNFKIIRNLWNWHSLEDAIWMPVYHWIVAFVFCEYVQNIWLTSFDHVWLIQLSVSFV